MIENTDILSKKAAMKGLESAINIYLKRVEELAVEFAALGQEITDLEDKPAGDKV